MITVNEIIVPHSSSLNILHSPPSWLTVGARLVQGEAQQASELQAKDALQMHRLPSERTGAIVLDGVELYLQL